MTGPGAIVLIGSGETAAVGRQAIAWLRAHDREPQSIAVLETPAGFEPNSADVAARWVKALQGELPKAAVAQVAARKRGTNLSPDELDLAQPIFGADLIAIGAGSPTYAVRQLRSSAVWEAACAAHLLGASLLLASAGAMAVGRWTLPVYEIFKVGEDLHWADGLGLFDLYGLPLAICCHWDDPSGAEIDTSHAFMGKDRFAELQAQLPRDVVVLGIDEHTAVAIDPASGQAEVLGKGGVTIINDGITRAVESGTFSLVDLGPFTLPDLGAHVSAASRDAVKSARAAPQPPAEVKDLVAERERARDERDFPTADKLREEIAERGFGVDDTAEGPRLRPR